MTTLTINKYESNYTLPLYTDYAGQESTAYLCLDMRDGEVSFEERAPHNNGYSQDEFSGYVRTFKIPNNLTVSGLNELLQDRQVIDALRVILSAGEEIINSLPAVHPGFSDEIVALGLQLRGARWFRLGRALHLFGPIQCRQARCGHRCHFRIPGFRETIQKDPRLVVAATKNQGTRQSK